MPSFSIDLEELRRRDDADDTLDIMARARTMDEAAPLLEAAFHRRVARYREERQP